MTLHCIVNIALPDATSHRTTSHHAPITHMYMLNNMYNYDRTTSDFC